QQQQEQGQQEQRCRQGGSVAVLQRQHRSSPQRRALVSGGRVGIRRVGRGGLVWKRWRGRTGPARDYVAWGGGRRGSRRHWGWRGSEKQV
ncbi:unnamed protein product, partial [Ectocarpus sp. 12 AP-2014]